MIVKTSQPQPRTNQPVRVLAVSGSLRRDSYNRHLLQAAASVAPPGMSIHLHDTIADVPLFDEDLERENPQGPDGVRRLRAAVTEMDGLLIATPEYNHSLPGVLKNTIDWLSRPVAGGVNVLAGKPAAIVGATYGAWGTRLAQAQLRQILAATGSSVMPAPMLFVRDAAHVFDRASGHYDAATQQKLSTLLASFHAWISQLTAPRRNDDSAAGSR